MIALVIVLPLIVGLTMFFPYFRVQQATAHALLETVESLSLDSYGASKLNDNQGPYVVDIKQVQSNETVLGEAAKSGFTSWDWKDPAADADDPTNAGGERNTLWSRLDKWYVILNGKRRAGDILGGRPGHASYPSTPGDGPDDPNALKPREGSKAALAGRIYEMLPEFQERIIDEVIRPRFVLYLGGDYDVDHTKTLANDFLKRMYVVPSASNPNDYVGGLKFSRPSASGNVNEVEGTTIEYNEDTRTYTLTVELTYEFDYPMTRFLNIPFKWQISQRASTRLWARPQG